MRWPSLLLWSGLLGAALAAPAPQARAQVAAAQLKSVEAAPEPNAALPLGAGFVDEAGRPLTLGDAIGGLPTVLVFVDYTCRTLCGPILDFTVTGLGKSGLEPGADYRLVAVGIDPKDGSSAALAMRQAHIDRGDPIGRNASFLSGTQSSIHAVTQAAGLRYYYDAEHDQYAHPAAAFVIDGKGRVRRVLSPLGLDGADLRLAIVDAGQGLVGTLADRIHLLCYSYDPVKGIYTERITAMLSVAAVITLLALFGGISLMAAREKRSQTP